MARVHHSAICTNDIDESLRFWRDGMGFRILMDQPFEGDWPTLFNAPSDELRSVFLGDPDMAEAGLVELVSFREQPGSAPVTDVPTCGFFLLSVFIDLDATRGRLADVGYEPEREISVSGVRMAVVRDPNGVLVELIDRDRMP